MTFPSPFKGNIDGRSLACTPIEFFDLHDEILRGMQASGFLYRYKKKVFLVTARHVLSGTDTFTDKNISNTGFQPRKVQIFPYLKTSPSGKRIDPHEILIRDQHNESLWLEDPEFAELRTDIACLEIHHQHINNFMCMNDNLDTDIVASVGFDAYVVGYPNPKYHDPYLPIWRRGSFAYEPLMPVDDKPIFLLDGMSSKGMSGSPIIQRWHGPVPTMEEDGQIVVELKTVSASRLIGVYGGRLSSNTEMGEIGYGWYANRIDAILSQT